MSPRMRRLALPLMLLVVGLLALGTATYLTFMPGSRAMLPATQIGGPFALVDQEGRPTTERDFAGAPYLVFFGFTHCPDVCPTKLFEISEMFRAMGERGGRARALFITIDPERDDPAVMKSYLSSFDQRVVGLTGDPAAIERAVKAFRAYAKKVPLKDGDYTMEHTALVYLMDKTGAFVGAFNLERPPAEAAQDLLKRL